MHECTRKALKSAKRVGAQGCGEAGEVNSAVSLHGRLSSYQKAARQSLQIAQLNAKKQCCSSQAWGREQGCHYHSFD